MSGIAQMIGWGYSPLMGSCSERSAGSIMKSLGIALTVGAIVGVDGLHLLHSQSSGVRLRQKLLMGLVFSMRLRFLAHDDPLFEYLTLTYNTLSKPRFSSAVN